MLPAGMAAKTDEPEPDRHVGHDAEVPQEEKRREGGGAHGVAEDVGIQPGSLGRLGAVSALGGMGRSNVEATLASGPTGPQLTFVTPPVL